jgi:hypothetical protein
MPACQSSTVWLQSLYAEQTPRGIEIHQCRQTESRLAFRLYYSRHQDTWLSCQDHCKTRDVSMARMTGQPVTSQTTRSSLATPDPKRPPGKPPGPDKPPVEPPGPDKPPVEPPDPGKPPVEPPGPDKPPVEPPDPGKPPVKPPGPGKPPVIQQTVRA